jgi:bifunctional non-homologous end joining protein LigD
MAPVMLPYYTGKPQTLNRYPNGITGKTFYQKNVKGNAPIAMLSFGSSASPRCAVLYSKTHP